jgi:uncharacterized protein YcbX
MGQQGQQIVGVVTMLHRYPVKSMLGETCDSLAISARGALGDRAWALLDSQTHKVASAKRPKLWRALLLCAARTQEGRGNAAVEVQLPDGTIAPAGDPALDRALSSLLARPVRLSAQPPEGAELDRAYPEAVLADGLDADVGADVIKIGAGSPPGTFLDFAPLHVVTTATLDGITEALDGLPIEPERYRPNVVISSPSGTSAFQENHWVNGKLSIGDSVTLRIVLPTPRCAIPTLAHGELPARNGALTATGRLNKVDIPGFGIQPCAGVYAKVITDGVIRNGDQVIFTSG